jgi:hypothetical protein
LQRLKSRLEYIELTHNGKGGIAALLIFYLFDKGGK